MTSCRAWPNCWTRPTSTPTRWSSASSPCFAASASARSWCGWPPSATTGRTLGYIVTFDDITVLLSAQRQSAWAEVARRIAHEVKNPLTPIRLSAERLERKYSAQIQEGREVVRGLDRHHHPPGRHHRPADQRVLRLRPDAGRRAARGGRRRAGARRRGAAAIGLAEDQVHWSKRRRGRCRWSATAKKCRRRSRTCCKTASTRCQKDSARRRGR